MIDQHLRNLRIDRRMLRRRGWITPEELEEELGQLPDAADKAEYVDPLGPPGEPGPKSASPKEGA